MTTTTITTEHEQLLIALETTISRATIATQERAALLSDMHQSGMSLQQLANVMNIARRRQNIPLVTRHGVFRMIERARQ